MVWPCAFQTWECLPPVHTAARRDGVLRLSHYNNFTSWLDLSPSLRSGMFAIDWFPTKGKGNYPKDARCKPEELRNQSSERSVSDKCVLLIVFDRSNRQRVECFMIMRIHADFALEASLIPRIYSDFQSEHS